MNRASWVLVLLLIAGLTAGVQTQQPPASVQSTALPAPVPREPSWAFQVQGGSLPAEPPEPASIPGSTRKYTPKEIDDLMNPPDWFPDAHPPAPGIVQKGRPGVLACGGCHLMSGLGHPESADLTGYTEAYLTRQMMDFRSGDRQDFAARMNPFAKAMTDQEIREASAWFASLPRQKFVRVVEAAMVPKTFVGQGRMRFIDPAAKGEMEPIGSRIITLPEDQELARRRDPRSGFVAYVPPGSIERGRMLADTGGNGKTLVCATCHGEGLKGQGDIPRLAGVHPIYLVRQLYHFKEGTRKGPDAVQMLGAVGGLSEQDILDLAAYAGSLPPQ
jgi:cytochrome c553